MRISLPTRVPMSYVGIFASLLFLLQQVDRTDFFFSVCSFLFVIVSGLAFNLAGGLSTASGGYVFFYSVLTVIIGLVWKTVQGEAAQTNLLEPRTTIGVFLGGIFGMLIAVLLSRKLTRKRAFLANLVTLNSMQSASTGCLIMGTSIYLLSPFVPSGAGSLWSAVIQVNRFNEMAIILGVTYQIRKSGGKSSVNTSALAAAVVIFIYGGLLSFSKQAMFVPLVCWVLAAGAQGYRISKAQMLASFLLVVFMFQFMVPYAQYGRSQTESGLSPSDTAINLLSNLGSVRDNYVKNERETLKGSGVGYFNTPQGFFDRLQMMYPDSTLIESTERLGPYGIYPIVADIENLIPHVFWANKPQIAWGNVFAHQALTQYISEEDASTGISFSPSGEAYRLLKWVGVLVLAPVIWTALFTWFDSLCGDVRKAPWGLLALTLFAHTAPEGMLDSCIYMMGYGAFAIIVSAVSTAYVMPHIGVLFAGPGGRNRFLTTNVRSLPRRVSVLESTEAAEA